MIRAGRDGEPLRQVFRYPYDPLGRRIAKEDDFGVTRFVWEGLRLLLCRNFAVKAVVRDDQGRSGLQPCAQLLQGPQALGRRQEMERQ